MSAPPGDHDIGDRVSGEGHLVCGKCRNCRAGHFHLCPNTVGLGVNRPGAFAEYLALPAFNVFKLPEYISDDSASILDPFGNLDPLFCAWPTNVIISNVVQCFNYPTAS